MKINQILIFITTAVVLFSISSSGPVDSTIINWAGLPLGCVYDGNCDPSEKCSGFSCRSACQGVICDGEQKVCVAVNHAATCRQVSKNSRVGGSSTCGEVVLGKDCSKDCECDSSEECKCSVCTNVCYNKCDKDQACLIMEEHVAKCVKKPTKCKKNEDCEVWEKCNDSVCKNACDDVECKSVNEGCQIENHKGTCQCWNTHARNTTSKACEKQDCRWTTDCKGFEICSNVNSVGKCKCPLETRNRGEGYCAKQCTTDLDCNTSAEECDTTEYDGLRYCKCVSGKKFDSKSNSCE